MFVEFSRVNRRFIGVVVCTTAVAAGLLLTGQAGGAPAPAPVVMTDVCVNPARGQLSFPLGGTCPAGYATVAVDDPSATFEACYLNSNGAIRKLSAGSQCTNSPRSKKETLVIVPSLTSDLYLCASTADGTLFFRGTSPVTCKSGQFLVVIEQANNRPVAQGGTLTTLEDTVGATTLSATDEDGDALTFAIASQGAKGTAALTGSVGCDGLTPSTCTRGASYTPQANANGSDSFTFTASDAFATSAPATVAVTITPVNDAPSFTKGGDQTVDEDAGAQSVSGWATGISAGPANESSQNVSFSVTSNSNPSLFAAGPAVSPTGTLTYTPAANAFGTATVELVVSDDGGTANGGVDTSAAQSFTITVDAVNDAPSFTKGADDTVLEDSGARSVASWATGISAGPNEGSQTVSFQVSNDNPSLFSSQPAVSPSGALTYTPAPNAFGSATVMVVAQDDGGTANGGDDTSDAQTFAITVSAVNDAPSFDIPGGDPPAVDEDATAQVVSGFATSMSAGPNESGQVLTFIIVDNSNTSLFNGIAGLPTIDPATGDLTYTPAPNANGAAIVEVRLQDDGGTANGGVDTSASRFFTITVNAVNDAPSFVLPAVPNQTVNEDAGAQALSAFASLISKGPADESGQVLTFTVTNDNNTLFFAQPDIDESTGLLTYTPADNAYGTAIVSVTLSDNGGTANGGVDTSGTQQFTITVTPVNDEPSFSLPASPNQTVVQDSGDQSVPGFATSISAGPNEGGQTVAFTVTNNNNTLFSAQPAISPGGTLTYTPATGATGSATVSVSLMDDGGTANGGDDTSPMQTFTITVKLPNEPPVAVDQVDGDAVAATEDGGAVTITLTATDADGDVLTLSIVDSPTKGALGNFGTVSCDGLTPSECTQTVDYTPSANENGADSFTFKANDGTADSNTATVEIAIQAVNDAPSFTKGADETVLEDAGAQTVNGWATGISAGPADEASQTVSFNVTGNTDPALFAVAPAVDSDGDLTYTPADDAFGSATITIEAQDDGGTANGGDDTSDTQTFAINVTAVNDAPSFTAGANQSVAEDAGAQSVSGWATAISKGPANESGQTVSFVVTGNTNPGLFSAGPAVSSTGTLTFTTAANLHGSATITLKLTDDGGTANGGVDESATQQFDITVTAVNDAPTSPGRAYGLGSLQANMQRSIAAADGLLVGAADAADVAGNGGYTPAFTVGSVNGVTPVAGTITTTIAGVGTVVANASTGAFSIDPAPGVTGNVSFPYTVCDSGDGAPASACSAAATASFNIAGPVIWFVNPAAGTNGDGRLSSPFNVLSGADAVDAANHRVFVYSGSTTTGLALNSDEWLIGQGATGASFDALFSISPPAGTIARPSIGGTRPTIGGTVALNANARVQGLNITTSGVTGLTGSGANSGVSVSEAAVSATNAAAVNLNATGGSIALDSTSSSGSATSGIALTNVTASFTGGTGTIANAVAADVAISGGDGAFDYDGSISDDIGALVTVASTTGGAKSFDGAISDLNNDTGSGISLTNNGGATINFTGGLTLSTGGGAPALAATGGGTLNITGTNTIETGTGTALSVTNTTIGASGLTFRSIASNGAVNGIVLNNTGNTAGLTVTGTGSAGTGGTIQNSTGAGILLTSTRAPSFSWMNVQNGGDDGIRGSGVNGFTLANSTVFNNGNAVNESGLDFVGGLTGTASISSSTVNTYAENGLIVTTASGSLNLTVTGSSFTNASATTGNDGIHLDANDTAAITASITGSTFDNNRGDHFQFSTNATSSGTNSVTFSSNTLTGDRGAPFGDDLGAGITISTTGSSDTAFTLAGNNIQGAVFPTIGIDLGTASTAGATLSGTVDGNTIGNALVSASGGAQSSAIALVGQGAGTLTAAVTNNVIRQNDGFAGIDILSRDGSPTINATVTGNNIAIPSTGGGNGLLLRNGAITTDGGFTCAAITGNSLTGSAVVGLDDFRLRQRFNTTVRLPGYGGAAGDTAAVVAFVQGNNPGIETGSATADFNNVPSTGGGFVGGAACPTP